MFFGSEIISPKQRCSAADAAVWKQLWFGFSQGSAASRFHGLAPGRRPLQVFVCARLWERTIVTSLKRLFMKLKKKNPKALSERSTWMPGHFAHKSCVLWLSTYETSCKNGPGQPGSRPVQVFSFLKGNQLCPPFPSSPLWVRTIYSDVVSTHLDNLWWCH